MTQRRHDLSGRALTAIALAMAFLAGPGWAGSSDPARKSDQVTQADNPPDCKKDPRDPRCKP